MNWVTIASLIAQYGLPFADKIVMQWLSNPNAAPTVDEWNSLKALAANNAKTMMVAALSRAGIDPNSDQGKALLAMAP